MAKPASVEQLGDTEAPPHPAAQVAAKGNNSNAAAGSGKQPATVDAFDVLESLTGSIEAPADWAAEHDHYLYGTPKRG